MVEDLTPEHMRCPFADCPSIHRLEDGSLEIVGDLVEIIESVALAAGHEIKTAEAKIKIQESLLSTWYEKYFLCQANAGAGGERSSPSALHPIGIADAEKIAHAVAGCHDWPVIGGIFLSLGEAFPQFMFHLDEDGEVHVWHAYADDSDFDRPIEDPQRGEMAAESGDQIAAKGAELVASQGDEPVTKIEITVDPQVCGGRPVFVGTRFPIFGIVELLADGYDTTAIKQDFPEITDVHIRAAMHYVLGFCAQENDNG